MRISFPKLPSLGQSFNSSGRNWKWSGTRWDIDSVVSKTPYQVAVESGYSGTEQEWADSLNPATVAAAAMAAITESAPSTLDTIAEIANALGNDANFATTITNQLAAIPGFTISNSTPTSQDGNDGDIWIVHSGA